MESLPPVITPFGPLKAPRGSNVIQLRPRHAPLRIVERRGDFPPTEPRRIIANDPFEPEWDPLPFQDDGLDEVLNRDSGDYALIAYVVGAIVLVIGVIAYAVLR